ncbi:hypothetical protein P7C70_g6456, partial [Phenoliferia sp. Uapishka_3]
MSSSGSSSVDSLFDALESAWSSITSANPNLHELPEAIHTSLADLYARVTQGGTLPPLPDFPSAWSPPVIPTPPPPPPPNRFGPLGDVNPYLTAFVTTGVVAGGTYYFFPRAVERSVRPILRPLKQLVPVVLLPESPRPARIYSSTQTEIRKEVVLVLGADGAARELALDLEQRGFVVICTVQSPADCQALEQRSRGWMKVLVLDPFNQSIVQALTTSPTCLTQSSSVAPFLRSLSTALSLRFPLHSSGDPFSRPTHTLALTAVINCLSLYPQTEGLCPVEGLETSHIRQNLGERVATVVAVLGGVLPILRTMASRPSAPEGVLLSLIFSTSSTVPATTCNISLPFLSLSSAADRAILSILDSLRRELAASRTPNIRVAVLETGIFDLPLGLATRPAAALPREPLPVRLDAIYAPALARRHHVFSGTKNRKGSSLRKLNRKVIEMIIYGAGGRKTCVGAGGTLLILPVTRNNPLTMIFHAALTYRFFGALPAFFIDSALSFHDRLLDYFLRNSTSSRLGPAPEVPLPQQASGRDDHPTSLRPGYSMPPSSTASRTDPFAPPSADGYDSGSDEGLSSIEDFGINSGMGSFVGVEKDEVHA